MPLTMEITRKAPENTAQPRNTRERGSVASILTTSSQESGAQPRARWPASAALNQLFYTTDRAAPTASRTTSAPFASSSAPARLGNALRGRHLLPQALRATRQRGEIDAPAKTYRMRREHVVAVRIPVLVRQCGPLCNAEVVWHACDG